MWENGRLLNGADNDEDTFTYSNKAASVLAEGIDMSEEDEDELADSFLIEDADESFGSEAGFDDYDDDNN